MSDEKEKDKDKENPAESNEPIQPSDPPVEDDNSDPENPGE